MTTARTRKTTALMILVATLVATLVPILVPSGAGALGGVHCVEQTTTQNGRVICERWSNGSTSSDGSSGSGSSVSPEDRWNRYCVGPFMSGANRSYQPGFVVQFVVERELPPEEVNADEYGPYTEPIYPRAPYLDPTQTYDVVRVTCQGNGLNFIYRTVFVQGTAPVVDIFALRDRALAQITVPTPVPGSNPPFDQPGTFGVVQIPTWFWIEPSGWSLRSGTEAADGFVVTVVATPVQARWDTGDGTAPLVCNGPGVVWSPGLADSATTCSHTYTSSSADEPGARYGLEVTTTWEFSWTLNGAPQGVFGNATPATTFELQVGEIQAIES